MSTLQWAVLGLVVLYILLSAKYAVFPTLRELHEREQREQEKQRLEAKSEAR